MKTATEVMQKQQPVVEVLECAQGRHEAERVHEGTWVALRELHDATAAARGSGLRSEHDEKMHL